MKLSIPGSTRQPAWGLALTGVGLAVGALLVAWADPSLFDNDAAQYLSVAENYLAGNGNSTSLVFYEEHYRFGSIPVPQTIFPPGYPILIALLASLGLDTGTAALTINLTAWVLCGLLIFNIARATGCSPRQAFITSAPWFLLVAGWFNALGGMSEMPFICFTLLSVRAVVQYRYRESGPVWLWLAGGLAGFSLCIRYAGVSFVMALVILAVLPVRPTPRHWLPVRLAGLGSTPALIAALLFLANHLLVGDFKGGNPDTAAKSVAQVLRLGLVPIRDVTGFSWLRLQQGAWVEISFFVALVTVAVVAVLAARRHGRIAWATVVFPIREWLPTFGLVYPILTALLFLYLDLRAPIGLTARTLLPMVPFLLLTFGSVIRGVVGPRSRPRPVAIVALAVLVLSATAGQLEIWGKSRGGAANGRAYRAIDRILSDSEVERLLDEVRDSGRAVLADEPQMTGLIARIPTVGLATGPYTLRTWTTEETWRLVHQYRPSHVVVYAEPVLPADENQVFFEELRRGAVPDWLDPVIANSKVTVLAVRPSR